jgi:drug/metabolite transporter (DMT)-like permease
MRGNQRLFAYLVTYILLTVFQYPFAKDALRFANPATLMALRFSIAAFAIFLLAHSFRLILNKDTLLLSAFTALSAFFWIYGLDLVSPAQSAVLSYTMPIIVIPLSAFILKERATKLGWIGALVGFSGVIIYGLGLAGSGGTVLGGLLTVSGALFWGLFTIYYKKVRNQDPMTTVATQFLICAIVFWLVTPVGFALTINPEFVFEIAYISLLNGAVGFTLWNAMVGMETVVRLTTLIFAVPATTVAFQAVETGIAPSLLSVIGIGVMFLGIYISRARRGTTGAAAMGRASGSPV